MLVLNDNLVLSLVSGLDFGDGHHYHVVVVAVADQLVPPTFLDHGGTLGKNQFIFMRFDQVTKHTCIYVLDYLAV